MAAAICLITGCAAQTSAPESSVVQAEGDTWNAGFSSYEIAWADGYLYIAGFHNGVEFTATRDTPRASAVWLDVDGVGVLLISVDCIALASDTVAEIRARLADFCADSGCASVNVTATHTHAGVDTLGLWGPEGVDGKNPDYMENLIQAAVDAAQSAYDNRTSGQLYYSAAETGPFQYDSRNPQVYDENLYQLRFVSDDAGVSGIRILSYGAHAESLGDDNTELSRDYPGVLCDYMYEQTGDNVLFLPGAVGGQIMMRTLYTGLYDVEENLNCVGEMLAQAILEQDTETLVAPTLAVSRVEFDAPLDNTLYLLYKFLGVLGNTIHDGDGATGYSVRSELSVLSLGDVSMLLLPGEIFPELVLGDSLGAGDPEALKDIAASFGYEKLITVGLTNDELGYIVPPSDFVLNEELPYISTVEDSAENHYEETNSIGPALAPIIADAARTAWENMQS